MQVNSSVINLIQTQGTVHMNAFKKHLGRIEKALKSLYITIEKDFDSQTSLSQKEDSFSLFLASRFYFFAIAP